MQVKTSVLGDVIVASGDRLIDAPLMYNPTILCMLLREYTFLALLVVHAGWVSFSFYLSLYIYSYPPPPFFFWFLWVRFIIFCVEAAAVYSKDLLCS